VAADEFLSHLIQIKRGYPRAHPGPEQLVRRGKYCPAARHDPYFPVTF
jgi:hypothetical protein